MPTTTFEAIALADLSTVQGGCGKKKCQCPPPPPPQAPPPAPMGGTEITTNVQMTGFGTGTTAQ
jgi:hypothetical protein